MGRTGALRHTHRYLRTRPRNEIIWRCTLPNCTHFIPLNITVVGRSSLCWQCGEAFTMEEKHLTYDQPLCESCLMKKQGIDIYSLTEKIEADLQKGTILSKAGVSSVEELSPTKRRTMENLGLIPKHESESDDTRSYNPPDEPDEIEVFNPDEEN